MHFRVIRSRRALSLLGASLLTGASVSFAISAMAAWDLSYPPPGSKFQIIGADPCGFREPVLLRLWRDYIAHEHPEVPYDSDRGHHPTSEPADKLSPYAEGFTIGKWWWKYQIGRGYYDRVLVTTVSPAAQALAENDLSDYPFEKWLRNNGLVPWGASERTFIVPVGPSGVRGGEAFGTEPVKWSPSTLWDCRGEAPNEAPTSRLPSTVTHFKDIGDLGSLARRGHVTRRQCETRAYGWPLRSFWIRGVREQEWQIEWVVEQDGDQEWAFRAAVRDDHWTDALVDVPADTYWCCDAELPPASGIPWRPLWLGLLANSLILGIPLTFAGVGLGRGTRWCWRRVRSRHATQCAHCGYSRAGIPQDALCPECGKSV